MKYSSLIFFLLFMISCNSSKTVYLSNKSGKPITLFIEGAYPTSYRVAFKDSLHGKRIEKSLVINFGNGKWTKEEETELKNILAHTHTNG